MVVGLAGGLAGFGAGVEIVGVVVCVGLFCKIVRFGSLDSGAACRGAEAASRYRAKYIAVVLLVGGVGFLRKSGEFAFCLCDSPLGLSPHKRLHNPAFSLKILPPAAWFVGGVGFLLEDSALLYAIKQGVCGLALVR